MKAFLANLALVIVSVLVGFVALEVAFFRFLLPEMPGHLRPHLSEAASVLGQSSKADYVPHRYVALLGDSNAAGYGDWQIAVGMNNSAPYHSAHILRARLGQDVVSFGDGGASSAEALVRFPTRILEGSRCLVFPTLDRPERMVVYFYEGNDLIENLEFLEKVRAAYGSDDTAAIDRYLAEVYGRFAAWRCHVAFGDAAGRIARYHYRRLRGESRDYATLAAQVAAMAGERPAVNSLMIAGQMWRVPEGLQGPALQLDEAQRRKSIGVFDRSLAWLRSHFADIPTTMVYLPSQLSIYRPAGDTVAYIVERRHTTVETRKAPAADVARNSDSICEEVRRIALGRGTHFVDARPALRAAALKRSIHGPLDWMHLNESGYRVLGDLVAERLKNPGEPDACR